MPLSAGKAASAAGFVLPAGLLDRFRHNGRHLIRIVLRRDQLRARLHSIGGCVAIADQLRFRVTTGESLVSLAAQEADRQHDSGNDNATTMHRRQRLHDAKIIRRVLDFSPGLVFNSKRPGMVYLHCSASRST